VLICSASTAVVRHPWQSLDLKKKHFCGFIDLSELSADVPRRSCHGNVSCDMIMQNSICNRCGGWWFNRIGNIWQRVRLDIRRMIPASFVEFASVTVNMGDNSRVFAWMARRVAVRRTFTV
jgi:hypothetical protein